MRKGRLLDLPLAHMQRRVNITVTADPYPASDAGRHAAGGIRGPMTRQGMPHVPNGETFPGERCRRHRGTACRAAPDLPRQRGPFTAPAAYARYRHCRSGTRLSTRRLCRALPAVAYASGITLAVGWFRRVVIVTEQPVATWGLAHERPVARSRTACCRRGTPTFKNAVTGIESACPVTGRHADGTGMATRRRLGEPHHPVIHSALTWLYSVLPERTRTRSHGSAPLEACVLS
jgi:hypothetical protein